jgi:hypothetical protein
MRAGSESRRAIVGAIVGLLYGSILAYLSLLAAGAGHGTFLPILLSSAPLGVFGYLAALFDMPYVGFVTTLLGAPLLWATFGSLAATSGRGKWLRLTHVLALLHYASGLALVATRDGELAHLERVLRISPEFVVVWATVYLVGQVALWWRISRRNQLLPTI